MTEGRFSVIIPTRDRLPLLTKCLERLAPGTQEFPPERYQVVISDDGNDPRERIEQRYPWATWVAGPRRGPAANRNNGANHADYEWLVFLDDDCVPEPRLLAAYAEAIQQNPSVEVFEGRIYVDRPRRSLAECSPQNGEGGFLWSCNFAIKRSRFDWVGRFEERFPFPAMEDVEFSYRLRKQGVPTLFVRDAGVFHPWIERNLYEEASKYDASLQVYLSLHPEEKAAFSGKKILQENLRRFFKETLPGAVQYRGAGLVQMLATHGYSMGMAWRAFLRDRSK